MKELLEALAEFGTNPESIGDNLFGFFSQITNMNWEELMAAGLAIKVLETEAWNKALAVDEKTAIKDPRANWATCSPIDCSSATRPATVSFFFHFGARRTFIVYRGRPLSKNTRVEMIRDEFEGFLGKSLFH
jgi:hypothetical protein